MSGANDLIRSSIARNEEYSTVAAGLHISALPYRSVTGTLAGADICIDDTIVTLDRRQLAAVSLLMSLVAAGIEDAREVSI